MSTEDFVRGLQGARMIAGHMPDCSAVRDASGVLADDLQYKAGVSVACVQVVHAIDDKMDELVKNLDRPTLIKLGIEFGLFETEEQGRERYNAKTEN